MPVSEPQKRAIKKYAQSKKGQAALQRAHQKRANTEEYREYQRQKQAEYRRRKREQQPTLSKDSQSEPRMDLESPPPVNGSDFSELDKSIARFEDNLLNWIDQQGLSYKALPLRYQAILNALQTWKVGQSGS